MLGLSKAIDENEICISINRRYTLDTILLLALLFLQKCLSDKIQHWNFANAVFGLGRMDVTIATIDFVLVINERMIYVDYSIFKVNIAPSQTNCFANTHTSPKQYRKDGIPMLVFLGMLQVVQKQVLFFLCQSTPFLCLCVGLLQFLQNIGVAIGTCISSGYRTVASALYLKHDILSRNIRFFIWHIVVDSISIIVVSVIWLLLDFQITGFVGWVLGAGICFCTSVIVNTILNYLFFDSFRNGTRNILHRRL